MPFIPDISALVELPFRLATCLIRIGFYGHSFSFSVVCCLVWLGTAQSATPFAQESLKSASGEEASLNNDQIRSLIRQLEDRELARRDEAEAAIIQLGREAIQFLPSVTPQTSGELKVRLQRIRQALEKQAVAGFIEASHVTLTGRLSLSQVVEKIREQTGNEIQLQNEENGSGDLMVDVNWDKTAFWNAVDDLLKQSGMRIVGFAATENQLVVAPGYGENSLASFTTGPFRVEVVSVACQQNFGSQLDGQTTINLLFSWEPRLEPLFMQLPMSLYRAATDKGTEIGATNAEASPEIRLNVGGSSSQIEFLLQRPDRAARGFKSLSGQFVVSIPSERHQYNFEKFFGGGRQTQKYGDVSVTLENSRRNGPVYEIRLFVEFGDAAGALDSFRGWAMSNRAYLADSKGDKIENVGFQTYGTSNNGVGVSYLFQINQDPSQYKLIYESPSAITRQTIDFELKDIPLP